MAVLILPVGVPEEDVVGKENGASCNPDGRVPEEDVVGKLDGAVKIGSRWWPQEYQLCGLV